MGKIRPIYVEQSGAEWCVITALHISLFGAIPLAIGIGSAFAAVSVADAYDNHKKRKEVKAYEAAAKPVNPDITWESVLQFAKDQEDNREDHESLLIEVIHNKTDCLRIRVHMFGVQVSSTEDFTSLAPTWITHEAKSLNFITSDGVMFMGKGDRLTTIGAYIK